LTKRNDNRPRAPSRELNPLLYGHHPDQFIVAASQVGDSLIRIYKRIEGRIQHEDVEFFPFFFLADSSLIHGFPPFHWLKELTGNHFFKYLVAFRRWSEMWEAVNFILNEFNKNRRPHATNYQDIEALFLRSDPVYQLFIQSGRTSFKGMTFEDLHRMQIDIQVYSRDQRPSGAAKGQNRIAVISLSDNRKWSAQCDGRTLDEKTMLERCYSLIRERDPDIIEGHDLFSFILPYLAQRSEQQGVEIRVGRDDTLLKTYQRRFPFEDEFTAYECPGRHFIDTSHLVRAYDYSKRSLEGYDLRHLVEHFGLTIPIIVHRQNVYATWNERPALVLQQSFNNTTIVRELSNRLSPSNFVLAQMCPFGYGTITELGAAARLESLIVREYLRQKHSLPQPQKGSQEIGGYAHMYVSGVLSHVLQADVESLYPSIMISQNVKPHSDVLGVFIPLLQHLTKLRLEAKAKMTRAQSAKNAAQYDAMQMALKILINSFYGYLAYSRALFNDFAQADFIARKGQSILKSIIEGMELFNAEPIEVDTDGIFFLPPDNIRGERQEKEFVRRMSDKLPEGINLVLTGRFKKMLSYKIKNYALLDYDDRLFIRGSSLASRALERFVRRFIRRCIECLLTEDVAQLHHTYASYFTMIKKHDWEPTDFCRTETLREDRETYLRLVEQGQRHQTAAYEAARRAGIYFKSGDRISYYVTGSAADVKISENSRVVEEWDPNLPDENTAYYLARLDETAAKFKDFFEPEDFKKIFSLDDLFGFAPKGIRVLTSKAIREKEVGEPKETEENEDFPIWLGDKD